MDRELFAPLTIESGRFTLADLDRLPENGLRYELVEGVLLVTPSRPAAHQDAVVNLALKLRAHCPPTARVLPGPLAFRPTTDLLLQPDVLVFSREDTGTEWLELPLLLAVEVLCPATRTTDLVLKRVMYEQSGVAAYWIFDPEAEVLTVLEMENGRYVERAVVKGDEGFEAEVPFGVRVVPAELVG
jgi:Uma2 family endonuclease